MLQCAELPALHTIMQQSKAATKLTTLNCQVNCHRFPAKGCETAYAYAGHFLSVSQEMEHRAMAVWLSPVLFHEIIIVDSGSLQLTP